VGGEEEGRFVHTCVWRLFTHTHTPARFARSPSNPQAPSASPIYKPLPKKHLHIRQYTTGSHDRTRCLIHTTASQACAFVYNFTSNVRMRQLTEGQSCVQVKPCFEELHDHTTFYYMVVSPGNLTTRGKELFVRVTWDRFEDGTFLISCENVIEEEEASARSVIDALAADAEGGTLRTNTMSNTKNKSRTRGLVRSSIVAMTDTVASTFAQKAKFQRRGSKMGQGDGSLDSAASFRNLGSSRTRGSLEFAMLFRPISTNVCDVTMFSPSDQANQTFLKSHVYQMKAITILDVARRVFERNGEEVDGENRAQLSLYLAKALPSLKIQSVIDNIKNQVSNDAMCQAAPPLVHTLYGLCMAYCVCIAPLCSHRLSLC